MTDPLPRLVRDFAQGQEATAAAELLYEVQRHVGNVSKSYPDAYFTLRQKNAEAVADLGNRVFTTCARVPKGRFPFTGREPFVAYAQEQFDGRAIRYHSFYAKLSITREIMRDDYARNICRDPVLRWRARLYQQIGEIVRQTCEAESQGARLPPRWRPRDAVLGTVRPVEAVVVSLREQPRDDVEGIVSALLHQAGPMSQSRLTSAVEEVLGTPAAPPLQTPPAPGDLPERLAVRRAVLAGWEALDPDDRALLLALARGDSYDELIAAQPRFRHRVAVTRAVARVGQMFVDRVVGDVGGASADSVRPKDLIELVLSVLLEALPSLTGGQTAEVGA